MKRLVCLFCTIALLLAAAPYALAQQGGFYAQGDTVEDFTLTTVDGETVTLSGLLREHKAVLLNFWYAGCGPCRYEFPFLDNAWQQLRQEVAVLAISPYDTDDVIRQYKSALGLSLPMAFDDCGLTDRFVDYGFPTSVLIDRNGVLCYSECGAQKGTDAFLRLLTPYLAEEYDEPLLLSAIPSPIIPAGDDAALTAALNVPGGSLTFATPDGVWPWVADAAGGGAETANTGCNNALAVAETTFDAQAGDALRFRVRTSTEEGYDVFAALLDGQIVKMFSGENGWQTYTLALGGAGEHTVSFVYSKNDLGAEGEDKAALADVELLRGDAAQQALTQNAVYPQTLAGGQAELRFLSADARRVVFQDPDGAVDAYYGADGYYLLPADGRAAHIRLGADCDPDAAMIRALDGTAHTLSHCAQDADGFLCEAPAVDPELGWNALLLFPSLTDASQVRVYLYFDSEEALDVFCATQVPDQQTGQPVQNVRWEYAEND